MKFINKYSSYFSKISMIKMKFVTQNFYNGKFCVGRLLTAQRVLITIILFISSTIYSQVFTPMNGISLTGVNSGAVAWADYDKDGDLDLLLTGYDGTSDGYTKIYENQGNDNFQAVSTSLIDVYGSSAAWSDYNIDTYPDILLTGTTTGPRSKIYKSNQNKDFTDLNIALENVFSGSVAWNDYDNDGDPDILLTGYNGSTRVSKIYKNMGGDAFQEPPNINLTGVQASSVAWGDYDNDGDPDILLSGNSGVPTTLIYENKGSDNFESSSVSLDGTYDGSVDWGDYNRDGFLDILITGNSASGPITKIYTNNGDKSFTPLSISLPGVQASSVAWGDYNKDSYPDILLTGDTGSGKISKIYTNNRNGTFSELTSDSFTGVDHSAVAWVDYNNDGELDIIITGSTSSGRISKIYKNTGNYPVFGQITLNSPNGGETWQVGTSQNITWTSSNVTNVKIEYTTDNGTSWLLITNSTPSDGNHPWTIPDAPSDQCKVRISDVAEVNVNDVSDGLFTIIESGTYISGIISSNTTWTSAGNPYIVVGNILVNEDVTLTIDPGVEIKFDGNFYIRADGTLNAQGTSQNLITFTSNKNNPSPGDWSVLRLSNNSVLNYCEIEYGGGPDGSPSGWGAVYCIQTSPIISNSFIHDNSQAAIHTRWSNATVTNNIIYNNPYGIYSSEGGNENVTGNHIYNNDVGIYLYGSSSNITYNTITSNNDFGIEATNPPNSFTVNFNNIYDNSTYNINNRMATGGDCEGSNNWWGTKLGNEIAENIYDFNDDFNLGEVEFEPYLMGPNLSAPGQPITVNSVILKEDETYSSDLTTNLNIGDNLYIELTGTDGSNNTQDYTSVTVSSSITDPASITVPLYETGINTGIYRGVAQIGNQSNDITNIIGAGSGESITIKSDIDNSKLAVVNIAPVNTIIVSSTEDSGPGSLRQALLDAVNGTKITFDTNIFPPGNPATISLTSGALPAITQGSITIDASNAGVILDGSQFTNVYGIYISSNYNSIKGIQIQNFDNGIGIDGNQDASYNQIGGNRTIGDGPNGEGNTIINCTWGGIVVSGQYATNNYVKGNYVGIDVNGDIAKPNERGINIRAPYNTIGSSNPNEKNVVSGNLDHGIWLEGENAHNNTIIGNFIGTDATGTKSIGNSIGVLLHEFEGGSPICNQIGGVEENEKNLISGNSSDGIHIYGPGADSNKVIGNYIGTNFSATNSIPNGGNGITIVNGARYNTIGGNNENERNIISGNDNDGISIQGSDVNNNQVIGNFIGTDLSGTIDLGNSIGVVIGHTSSGFNRNNSVSQNLVINNKYGGIWLGDKLTKENVISDNTIIKNEYGIAMNDTTSDNIIFNNIISLNNGCGIGVWSGSNKNTISGNFIGTDSTGNLSWGNQNEGIIIDNSSFNLIGGDSEDDRNIISGNGQLNIGIRNPNSIGNEIKGNYIGTNLNGTEALENGNSGIGIYSGANNNVIGGYTENERNVISGNLFDGIWISGNETNGNTIKGNFIGTNAEGGLALSNGNSGISCVDGTRNNIIGGSAAERNIISGNGWDGINIDGEDTDSNNVIGNYIGCDITGSNKLSNGNNGVSISNGAKYNQVGSNISEYRNIISANLGNGVGIHHTGTNNNIVIGNFIGVDASGLKSLGNSHQGVHITGGPMHNIIGGQSDEERNIISANEEDGIIIYNSSDNTITGNFVGTDKNGTQPLGNKSNGIRIDATANNNTIVENLISGNTLNGISFWNSHFSNVTGNFIGTDISGNLPLGNNNCGISIGGDARGIQIGGSNIELLNIIAFNNEYGIKVDGSDSDDNLITRNSIYSNSDKGIAVLNGANSGITTPVISSISDQVLTGTARPNALIEIFADAEEEGKIFLGDVFADDNGTFSKQLDLTGIPDNYNITATQTVNNNTSEFSEPISIQSILVTSPNGGENWTVDSTYNITWSIEGLLASTNKLLNNFEVLNKKQKSKKTFSTQKTNHTPGISSSIEDVKIEYSTNGGIDWTTIVESTPASAESYPWTIPDTPSDQCKVRISDASNNSVLDQSDQNFTISRGVDIEFICDMSVQIDGGNFNPTTGRMYLAGSFTNWADGQLEMIDNDNDLKYSVTVPLTAGETVYFKFRANEGWENDPNREYIVPNENSTFQAFYNNFTGGTNVAVTFKCDMKYEILSGRFDSANDELFVRGSFNEWSDIDQMFPSLSDQYIYELILNKKFNEGDTFLYKFAFNYTGGTNWEQLNDRTYTITAEDISRGYVEIFRTYNDLTESDLLKQPATIKFICDMNNAVNYLTGIAFTEIQNVFIAGAVMPLSWPTGGWPDSDRDLIHFMHDDGTGGDITAGDNKWTTELTFPIYSPLTIQYKYGANWGLPSNAGSNDNESGSGVDHFLSIPNDLVYGVIENSFGEMGNHVISLTGTVVVNSPNGGENWIVDSTYAITWESTGVDDVKLEYTTDNGSNWLEIVQSTKSSGSYEWTIPDTPSEECKMRISDVSNPSVSDVSDGIFTISHTILPTITVLSPNGGENWIVGNTYAITWESTGIDDVKLEYTTDNGSNWTIITITASDGMYEWTIPDNPSVNCKIRVSDSDNPNVFDESDNTFTISQDNSTSLMLLSPNGNEIWKIGNTYAITWEDVNVNDVTILYSTNNGNDWITIESAVASTGSYNWIIPNTPSTNCKVMIHDEESLFTFDTSDDPFAIVQASISVTSPQSGDIFQAGQTKTITWKGENVENVKIEFTSSGGNFWSTITESTDASNQSYTWVVPSVDSDNCKVRISDASNSSIISYSGTFTIFTYPTTLTLSNTTNFGSITETGSYRMIGLPGNVNIPVSETLQGTAGMDWKVYYDDGAEPVNYKEWDGSSLFNFIPGRAFWVLSKNPFNISQDVTNVTLSSEYSYEIPLHDGWNMISNPFLKTLDWIEIKSMNNITENIHHFTGSYSISNSLEPYIGYYFNNATNLAWLELPYITSSVQPLAKTTDERNNEFNLMIKNGRYSSQINIGYNETSTIGYDRNDRFAPPSNFEIMSIRIKNDNLKTDYKYLMTDYRPEIGDGQLYDIEMKLRPNDNYSIKAEGKSLVGEHEIYLIDERLKTLYDLKAKNDIQYHSLHEKNTFKLVIGNAAFVNEIKDKLLPKQFILYQNYPNPFNPNTIIRFSLPEQGLVSITVYNILGELVDKVADSRVYPPGNFEILFEPEELTSGVYIYEINMSGFESGKTFNAVKKMLYVK